MNNKVEITIRKDNYAESVKNGQEFIAVDYDGKSYGGGSPCDNEQEVKEAVEHAEKTIHKAGDKPVIKDLRIKQLTLTQEKWK